MNARRSKAKNKHECSRSGLLLPSEMTFRSFSQSVVKRKLKISKADVKGLLAELLIFRIRFSILQTLQTCELTTRPESGNPVGTHIAFYPSTSGSPPTPSGAPPRSRQSVKGEAFIVFWVRRRRSRTQPSGLAETLDKVEVGVWSDFACLVAFLEISDFCSKSTKTQRGYPLRFGH